MEGIILIIISYIFSKITKQNKTEPNKNIPIMKMKLKKFFNESKENPVSFNYQKPIHESKENEFYVRREEPDSGINANLKKKNQISYEIEPGFEIRPSKKDVNLFKSRNDIRRAVIMSEILGKPKSINK